MAGMLAGVHVLLADRWDAPELEISEREAKAMLDRAGAVLAHYSVETSQKAIDWAMFVFTVGGVYVPRVVAITVRARRAGPISPSPSGATPGPAADRPPAAAGPAQRGNGITGAFKSPGKAPAEPAPSFEVDYTNNAPDEIEH